MRRRRRHGRSRLPQGQRTFTIKVGGGGRYAGEYEGASTVAATVREARERFLPHLSDHETLRVVHFDRDGERVITDKVIR